MEIYILKKPISRKELQKIAADGFGTVVKAVVDVQKMIMAIGGEFHSEGEVMLVEHEGSSRKNTWSINLLVDEYGDSFVEFDSMINLKPSLGNRSRHIEDGSIREKIKSVVQELVYEDKSGT